MDSLLLSHLGSPFIRRLPKTRLKQWSPLILISNPTLESLLYSSVTQLCPTLCIPMNRSTPGLPIHQQLLESTQTHVHWVGDAIQPSHPLSSPSPATSNLCQHQGLFIAVKLPPSSPRREQTVLRVIRGTVSPLWKQLNLFISAAPKTFSPRFDQIFTTHSYFQSHSRMLELHWGPKLGDSMHPPPGLPPNPQRSDSAGSQTYGPGSVLAWHTFLLSWISPVSACSSNLSDRR